MRQNMSRCKGRTSLKILAREFPYTVETAVPEGGLGRTLNRMYEFHALCGIKAQTGAGRRVDDCDIVTWLFADPENRSAICRRIQRHDVVVSCDTVTNRTRDPKVKAALLARPEMPSYLAVQRYEHHRKTPRHALV